MFSFPENTIVDLYQGSALNANRNQDATSGEQIEARRKMQGAYLSTAAKCSQVCLNSDELNLEDYEKPNYEADLRKGQRRLKKYPDFKSHLLGSCTRRCFLSSIERSQGSEAAEYAKLSAMEYDQSDIFHFRLYNYRNIPSTQVDPSIQQFL